MKLYQRALSRVTARETASTETHLAGQWTAKGPAPVSTFWKSLSTFWFRLIDGNFSCRRFNLGQAFLFVDDSVCQRFDWHSYGTIVSSIYVSTILWHWKWCGSSLHVVCSYFFHHLVDNQMVNTSDFTNWLTHWFSGPPNGRQLKVADIAMFIGLFHPVRIVISGFRPMICQKIKHDLKINCTQCHWCALKITAYFDASKSGESCTQISTNWQS